MARIRIFVTPVGAQHRPTKLHQVDHVDSELRDPSLAPGHSLISLFSLGK